MLASYRKTHSKILLVMLYRQGDTLICGVKIDAQREIPADSITCRVEDIYGNTRYTYGNDRITHNVGNILAFAITANETSALPIGHYFVKIDIYNESAIDVLTFDIA